jgi:DNA repair exonuclease SbcCD nuclease subunit
MTRRRLTLVHTSDIHLGCEFAPNQLAERALTAVVDLALRVRADVLLLPGDLVDYNRVPDATVEFLVEELQRFPHHSFVLPGNHDCYDDQSVYRRDLWSRRPEHVHLVKDAGEPDGVCLVPELGLEVLGRPVVQHSRSFRPLADLPPRRGPDSWRVGMAHGHFESPGEEPRSSPIFAEDIAAAECDYVALGHWDRQADVSQGCVIAHYSGAPYTWRGLASALVVTLDPCGGVGVSPAPLDRGSA